MMHLQENTLFDLGLGVKVTQNVTQYPLHHVIYAPTKFEVATFNGLREDTMTRNVSDGWTDARTDGGTTDRLWYEINIPYFSYEKAGIIIAHPGVSRGTSCLKVALGLLQLAYFVYARSKSPVEVMRTCRLVGAFATHRCIKNHHLVC